MLRAASSIAGEIWTSRGAGDWMDESWRVAMGPLAPRRRSTTDHPRHFGRASAPDPLDPDDFLDVFGGPPRTVLMRRFSGEFTRCSPRSFYDEILRSPEIRPLHGDGGGRSLPGFRIPAAEPRRVRTEEGFYDDIFGSDGGDKGRPRSGSGSLSERSPPPRAAIADDPMLAFFASELRPITIPSRQQDSSPPSTFSMEEQNGQRNNVIRCPSHSSFIDSQFSNNNNRSTELTQQRSLIHNNYFSCCFSPPETISFEPSSHGSIMKHGGDNSGINSPLSVISSFFLDQVASKPMPCDSWQQVELEPEKVVLQVEEAAENSCAIKIDSNGAEEAGGAVDEAIAWAKEKYWNQTLKENEARNEQDESKEVEEATEKKESSLAKGVGSNNYGGKQGT